MPTGSPADREAELIRVLDRTQHIDALALLADAIQRPALSADINLQNTAIAFDTNVLLRWVKHSREADLTDYLRRHSAPVIVPGQIIQEFWNNQAGGIPTAAARIREKFSQLKSEVEAIDPSFGEFSAKFASLMDEFTTDFGYIYDNTTIGKTHTLITMLRSKAIVPFASRMNFKGLAGQRKDTKTPPGYKDPGDGDFFVWVDLLTGLQEARANGAAFSRVVLLSHDEKPDWSRNGTPHPILSSEIRALFDVPFEIWKIEKFATEMERASVGDAANPLN